MIKPLAQKEQLGSDTFFEEDLIQKRISEVEKRGTGSGISTPQWLQFWYRYEMFFVYVEGKRIVK